MKLPHLHMLQRSAWLLPLPRHTEIGHDVAHSRWGARAVSRVRQHGKLRMRTKWWCLQRIGAQITLHFVWSSRARLSACEEHPRTAKWFAQ